MLLQRIYSITILWLPVDSDKFITWLIVSIVEAEFFTINFVKANDKSGFLSLNTFDISEEERSKFYIFGIWSGIYGKL